MISIAIDGPAGAGKSTIARRLAKSLGFIYVDTGALYRAIGYYVLSRGGEVHSSASVAALLTGVHIRIGFVDGEQRVFLNEEDVSDRIRTEAVSMAASAVSALPVVRDFLLSLQRDMAKTNHVVMDGRDIGTVVLPDADVKIFLTASVEERARRRYEQLRDKGASADYEVILSDMKKRDYNDSHREIAPLVPAEDAILINTTGNELQTSVDLMIGVVREKLGLV